MKNTPTRKKTVKQFRETVSQKLVFALNDYSFVMGEKEFQQYIRKATKNFSRDFSKAIERRISI
jgi:hypothetical protein